MHGRWVAQVVCLLSEYEFQAAEPKDVETNLVKSGSPSPELARPAIQHVQHDYFPAFDVFRGIGILFVLLAHSTIDSRFVDVLRPIGVLGVHMFFALSGFLITHRLVEEHKQAGTIGLAKFYKRRALGVFFLPSLSTLLCWPHSDQSFTDFPRPGVR